MSGSVWFDYYRHNDDSVEYYDLLTFEEAIDVFRRLLAEGARTNATEWYGAIMFELRRANEKLIVTIRGE